MKMVKKAVLCYALLPVWVSLVRAQSDSMCPANSAMGLCSEIVKPCFDDTDCVNGEICCPEACGRSCKPRNAWRAASQNSVPDLLNDPRVYIGQCPDASCFSLFGSEPGQCSTSQLCPEGQYCCSDGCKNVCLYTPEYSAMIAREKIRARQKQQMLIQRQQLEMRRKQQEMLAQQQRQRAIAEQSRKKAAAIAAAEAELAAQQRQAKYEADLKAMAARQAKARSDFEQWQKQQNSQTPMTTTNSRSDNNVRQQPKQQQTLTTDLSNAPGNFISNKKDNSAMSGLKQINSPANANPYGPLSQLNAQNKLAQGDMPSLVQSAPPTSGIRYPPSNQQKQASPTNNTLTLSQVSQRGPVISNVANGVAIQEAPKTTAYYPGQSPASINPTNHGTEFNLQQRVPSYNAWQGNQVSEGFPFTYGNIYNTNVAPANKYTANTGLTNQYSAISGPANRYVTNSRPANQYVNSASGSQYSASSTYNQQNQLAQFLMYAMQMGL